MKENQFVIKKEITDVCICINPDGNCESTLFAQPRCDVTRWSISEEGICKEAERRRETLGAGNSFKDHTVSFLVLS